MYYRSIFINLFKFSSGISAKLHKNHLDNKDIKMKLNESYNDDACADID